METLEHGVSIHFSWADWSCHETCAVWCVSNVALAMESAVRIHGVGGSAQPPDYRPNSIS